VVTCGVTSPAPVTRRTPLKRGWGAEAVGQRLGARALLVQELQLAAVVADVQLARVQEAALDALAVERVEALRPERLAVRRFNDDAPSRSGVAQ